MPTEVRGVVALARDEPVSIQTIVIPDPGPGEVVVDVAACGVCHTDLHYVEGGITDEFPFLLGHEAAGTVAAVGPGVTEVAPGDYVVLNWRAVCGQCRACSRGRPQYCFDTHNATQKMTLTDGTELTAALGIGAFAEKTLVAAGQCTRVDPAAPPEVAGPARVWCDGGSRCCDQHRRRQPWRQRGRDRLRRGGRTLRSPVPPSPEPSKIIAVDIDDRKLEGGQAIRRHPHRQLLRGGPGRRRSSA